MERDARYAVVARCSRWPPWLPPSRSSGGTRPGRPAYLRSLRDPLRRFRERAGAGQSGRYLGSSVGRVEHLSVSRKDPGRVRVVAEIDSEAPLSGATRASSACSASPACSTSTCSSTPEANAATPLAQGEKHAVIPARKGDIEAFLEKLPISSARRRRDGQDRVAARRREPGRGEPIRCATCARRRRSCRPSRAMRRRSLWNCAAPRRRSRRSRNACRRSRRARSRAQSVARQHACATRSLPGLPRASSVSSPATKRRSRASGRQRLVADLQQLVVDVREASVRGPWARASAARPACKPVA